MRLAPFTGDVDPDDPDANLKHDLAAYGLTDALGTVRRLARATDVPVGALVRWIVARWASAGAEALLRVGPDAVQRLAAAVDAVQAASDEPARRAAFGAVAAQVGWLRAGVDDPAGTYPEGGAEGEVEGGAVGEVEGGAVGEFEGGAVGEFEGGAEGEVEGGAGAIPRRARIGAYGLALREDAVLLVRIAEGFPGEGRWSLPGGGLQHGEDPLVALVREVAEETGLAARPGPVLWVDSNRIVADDDLHLLRIVHRVDVDDAAPLVREVGGSTAEAAWVALDALDRRPLLSLVTGSLERVGIPAPPPDRRGGVV